MVDHLEVEDLGVVVGVLLMLEHMGVLLEVDQFTPFSSLFGAISQILCGVTGGILLRD